MWLSNLDLTIFVGVTAHADLDSVPTTPSTFSIRLTSYYAECFAVM